MAFIEYKIDVDTRGPIFARIADNIMDACANQVEDEAGQKGVNIIKRRLHGVLRHPTGYYESHVQTERQGDDTVITDGGVVYGPWLEGVGSRNHTTRFKGYATFRRSTNDIDRETGRVAEHLVDRYAGRLD